MTTRLFSHRLAPRGVALAAAVCLLSAAPLPAAPAEYTSLAGLKAAGLQKFLDDARDQGYEPVYLNGYQVGDHVEYAGVAKKGTEKKPFESKFDMTKDELHSFWQEMMKKGGHRPMLISAYHTKDGPRFIAVWRSTKGDKYELSWHSKFDQEAKEYNDGVKAMRKDGYAPTQVAAYQGPDGAVRYSTLFYKLDFPYVTKTDMSREQYEQQLDQWKDKGFRAIDVHVYDSPDGLRFLASARKYPGDEKYHYPSDDEYEWQEHHDLTGKEYQKKFDELAGQGFTPGCICGYQDGGEVKFAAIWVKRK